MRWEMGVVSLSMLLWSGIGSANPEITVDLSGGAQMEMVWIESGTFMMGTTEGQEQLLRNKGLWDDPSKEEHPAHQVTISKGFYLGKYEITRSQWTAVVGTQPWSPDSNMVVGTPSWSAAKSNTQANPNNQPAVYISWDAMQLFVHKLNQAIGESLYRLPTEAEWEYACRAGTTTPWSYGDDGSQLGNYAWYVDSPISSKDFMKDLMERGEPRAVGTKLPNPWGLYDMHGNVCEWVQDWFGAYSSSSQTDPMGPASGTYRVKRGGSVCNVARSTRSAYRDKYTPANRDSDLGARLLRTK